LAKLRPAASWNGAIDDVSDLWHRTHAVSISSDMNPLKAPNYGIDAPDVQRRFLMFGLAGIVAAIFLLSFGPRILHPALAISLGMTLVWPGIFLLACAAIMFWGSKAGKLRLASKLVEGLSLGPDAKVLDVGCGHGLLLITAAKRLRTGKAIGLDLWQTEDQAGNSPEATLANARLEAVADRIELKTGDARQIPFEDSSFDAVVSSWALHNIYERAGRERAIREIARVLKPGGCAAIVDIRHTNEYAQVLRGLGFTVARHGPNFIFVIPSYRLLATKPPTTTR
jgi:ubiquinone/menaquinone biosynthesis C-methylase UbiE